VAPYSGSVPDTAVRRRDWMDRTACRDEDPDLFSDKARTHDARLVCVVRCPVRQQCLANVKETERGATRDCRDGVVAGLVHNERYRMDPHVRRNEDDSLLLELDGTEPCGTYNALLGHLWRGEPIDPACWSAEVRRERLSQVSTAPKRQPAAESPAPETPPALVPMSAKPPLKGSTSKQRHVYRLWARGLPDLKIARGADLSTHAVRRIRQDLGLIANQDTARAAS